MFLSVKNISPLRGRVSFWSHRNRATDGKPRAASQRLDPALFGLSSLPCVSKASSSAPKISQILLVGMCKAVFSERIFVQTRRRPQGILLYCQGRRRGMGENPPEKTDTRLTARCPTKEFFDAAKKKLWLRRSFHSPLGFYDGPFKSCTVRQFGALRLCETLFPPYPLAANMAKQEALFSPRT